MWARWRKKTLLPERWWWRHLQPTRQHILKNLSMPARPLPPDGCKSGACVGGAPLTGHSIPDCYGAWEPTAIGVPLGALCSDQFDLLTTELFGPFQIVVRYSDEDIDTVLSLLEGMSNHLTAAVVSADVMFQNRILSATVNGTTYCGMRARTTGAPQNHWFGPSGDPRGAGIGTPEAIITTWSAHREIIHDQGPMPAGWETPPVI